MSHLASIEVFVCDSFDSFIELSDPLDEGRRFYRGQENSSWQLQPSLYRLISEGQKAPFGLESIAEAESKMLDAFQRRLECESYAEMAGSLPDGKNDIHWLLRMQAHGVPTRFLDFTEDCLVAAYFATNSDFPGHSRTDGAVYCVSTEPPVRVSKASDFRSVSDLRLALSNHPLVILQPSTWSKAELQQSSLFACWDETQGHATLGDRLAALGSGDIRLRKIIIPAHLKERFRLELFGFRLHPYPDLRGLRRATIEAVEFEAYAPFPDVESSGTRTPEASAAGYLCT